jgi:hypothetical protein
MSEELENKDQVTEEVVDQKEPTPVSMDDGVIKVNLSELNKPQEDAIQEQSTDASNDIVGQSEDTPSSEEVVEEVRVADENAEEPVQNEEQPILEEITEEEVQEQVEDLQDDIAEAIEEQRQTGVDLPDNIQKVVDFINETGGTLEDYVKLNTDYSSLNEQ